MLEIWKPTTSPSKPPMKLSISDAMEICNDLGLTLMVRDINYKEDDVIITYNDSEEDEEDFTTPDVSITNPKEEKKPLDPKLLAIYKDLEEQMKKMLGTKVVINSKNEKSGLNTSKFFNSSVIA